MTLKILNQISNTELRVLKAEIATKMIGVRVETTKNRLLKLKAMHHHQSREDLRMREVEVQETVIQTTSEEAVPMMTSMAKGLMKRADPSKKQLKTKTNQGQ
jgi:hypothetical protein